MTPPVTKSSEEILRNIATALRAEGFYDIAFAILTYATQQDRFECNKILAIIKLKL